MQGKRGVSVAAASAVALLVAVAVAMVGFSIYARNTAAVTGGFEKQAGSQAVKISERLTLVYWSRDGRIWLANDGTDPVTVIQIYVHAQLAWSGEQTIQPQNTVVIEIGATGNSLAVKTSSGALHVLAKEWERGA
ncbi:MAG: hypothetical protein QXH32_06610 [Candidatus Caldarchaeum sp.]